MKNRYFWADPYPFGNFFCVYEGENKWGEIYTSLRAAQVCFAHLLRTQVYKYQQELLGQFASTVEQKLYHRK